MYSVFYNAAIRPLVFTVISAADHITGVTGVTPIVVIKPSGGTWITPRGGVSEIGNGWYQVAPNPFDAGALGPLLLHAIAPGCDPTDTSYLVVFPPCTQ